MIVICTGINSRDRELLTAYLISQGIPDIDLETIVDDCINKAEAVTESRPAGYSDFATIAYKPAEWAIRIDRAYTGGRS